MFQMSARLLNWRLHLCDKVETEEDEGENMTLKRPFTNDKHLFSFLVQYPVAALLLLPSFIQPSFLSFPLLNGWVVIFPWDSWGGELSRTRCFIMPNKGTCSDHHDFGAVMKPSERSQALSRRQYIIYLTWFPIFLCCSEISSLFSLPILKKASLPLSS